MEFIYRNLKRRGDISETWFFNGRLYIKTAQNSKKIQISHIHDIYEHFGRVDIDGILSASRKPIG